MLLALALVLAQADAAAEIPGLIRALGSEGIEEREEAAARLKRFGLSAVRALEEAAKRGDADVRGRAAEILEHIARVERVRGLVPPELRLTLALREAPPGEALRQALAPFGVAARADEALAGLKVSLSLDQASLWETIEGLERATGASFDLSNGILKPATAPHRRSGTGPVRVTADHWGGWSSGGGPTKDSLQLKAWSPPGTWIASQEFEDFEMTDESGRRLDSRVLPGSDCVRAEGKLSCGWSRVVVDRELLKGVKSVTVRGTVHLAYPHDVERLAAPFEKPPVTVEGSGGKVTLQKLARGRPGTWEVDLEASGTERLRLLAGVEDARGRWIGDLHAFSLRPGGSTSVGMSGVTLEDGTPARLVVLRAIGADVIRVPFSLSGIAPPR